MLRSSIYVPRAGRIVLANVARCNSRASLRLLPHNASTVYTHSVQRRQNALFSTSARYLKKKSKYDREEQPSTSSGSASSTANSDTGGDPFDFSALEAGLQTAFRSLESALEKLKPGGRFNTDLLQSLPVQIQKGANAEQLRNVAQVIPRGRTVNIVVGDPEHVKAVSRAIAGSSHSLTPQQDPRNANTLFVELPPPTKEAMDATMGVATRAGETAGGMVREARSAAQKKLRQLELGKKSRPDDLRKAKERMEKVVQEANTRVKETVDRKRKALAMN